MRSIGSFILVVAACSSASSSSPADKSAPAPTTAAAPTTTEPTATPAPRAAAPSATDCASATFELDAGNVIAKIDGADVRFSELGPDAAEAERRALHTYCREVDRVRRAALQRTIDDRLVTKAAEAAGVDLPTYIRTEVSDKVSEPTADEIAQYYEKNKSPTAPPLELVSDQVAKMIQEERTQAGFETLLGKLRSKTRIEVTLPDVRPPAVAIDLPEHVGGFGPADAKVTVVEFSDFECPYCARAAETVSGLKQRMGDRVRFAYMHFPLSFHANAKPAAEYAQCAQEQGKFIAMHDEIFARSSELSTAALRGGAEAAGLDLTKLDECLASGRATQQVDEQAAVGRKVEVGGTPTFFINGRTYDGDLSADAMAQAIEAELAALGS